MISTPMVQSITDPKLLDTAFDEINATLLEGLDWLNYAFRKSKRIVKTENRKEVYRPAVYVDNNNYLELSPDKHIGNYSFWTIEDNQELSSERRVAGRLKVKASLIVWCDFRNVYGTEAENRTIENLKADVLYLLKYKTFKNSRFKVEKIQERAKNIFKEYTINEANNQFLMFPFCGIRLDGTLTVWETLNCDGSYETFGTLLTDGTDDYVISS